MHGSALAFGLGVLLFLLQLADRSLRQRRTDGMVIPVEVKVCAMVSYVGQNVNLGTADGGTMRLLVCIDRTRGVTQHIPNTLGYPVCKTPIKLSLWQLEERLVDTTLICHRCKQNQAKLARS